MPEIAGLGGRHLGAFAGLTLKVSARNVVVRLGRLVLQGAAQRLGHGFFGICFAVFVGIFRHVETSAMVRLSGISRAAKLYICRRFLERLERSHELRVLHGPVNLLLHHLEAPVRHQPRARVVLLGLTSPGLWPTGSQAGSAERNMESVPDAGRPLQLLLDDNGSGSSECYRRPPKRVAPMILCNLRGRGWFNMSPHA